MSVFNNINGNGYGIDFSDLLSERLEHLWDTNRDKFDELTEYIYEKFDWVSGLCTDAPTLFNDFETREEAHKCDVALNRTVHKWFRDNDADLKKIRMSQMVEVERLVTEWIDYVDGYGNECAYTDSILEVIKQKIKKI